MKKDELVETLEEMLVVEFYFTKVGIDGTTEEQRRDYAKDRAKAMVTVLLANYDVEEKEEGR